MQSHSTSSHLLKDARAFAAIRRSTLSGMRDLGAGSMLDSPGLVSRRFGSSTGGNGMGIPLSGASTPSSALDSSWSVSPFMHQLPKPAGLRKRAFGLKL